MGNVPGWVQSYLREKGIPDYCIQTENKKAEDLYKILKGPRNFVLILNKDPSHSLGLYYHLALYWTLNTGLGFEILDLQSLDSFSRDFSSEIKKYETASLLMVPYADPTDYTLKGTKGSLGSILSKRKARSMPFITDLYTINFPKTMKEIEKLLQDNITPVFGDQALSLFIIQNSSAKIIKVH